MNRPFRKYPVIITLFFLTPLCYSQHLTTEWSDGEILTLLTATTYRCIPDSAGELSIEPASVLAEGWPLIVRLKGTPASKVSINFTLPSILVGDGGGAISCTWDSTGLLWKETNRYFDPRVPLMIEISADSVAAVYLGIILNIPSNAFTGSYSNQVVCSIIDTVMKDSVTVTAKYSVDVSVENPITIVDGVVNNLSKGCTYTLDPEHNTIQPMVNGNESGIPWEVQIFVQPNANVQYFFILPNFLSGPMDQTIACSFDTNSLYWLESKSRQNPESTKCIPADSGGNITLRLGITLIIPSQVPAGDYTGYIGCELSYCGFHGKKDRRPLQAIVWGIYTVTVIGANNALDARALPTKYDIEQNYPNPFNPSTTIRYSLPRESRVVLKIFDILGREVAALVNGTKNAGEYTVQWDAKNAPSGLYFYRIVAGRWSETKKMLMIR